jgi:ribosomal-protein-alanine N-acetyltransferase
MIHIRPLDVSDAPVLAAAYTANWPFLAPWDPARPDAFFTDAGQLARVEGMLADRAVYPCAIELDGELVGTITLTQIEHGPAQSANLGYWVAQAVNGRGIASRAVELIVERAFGELGLHRLQAGTLAHNFGSQKVLANNGFERIGTARGFLFIAGKWQDHILFQRVNDKWESA